MSFSKFTHAYVGSPTRPRMTRECDFGEPYHPKKIHPIGYTNSLKEVPY